ncbi:hypothetical protein QE152_g25691 [Popillia japonica]|uniref:THAP-type domain-containing protein n=1 Tax=Popillia japonica TaxID=7064 RepID=A0AAW1JZQ8_POPJA
MARLWTVPCLIDGAVVDEYKCGLSLIMGKAGICSKHFNLEDFGPNKKLKKIVFPKCYLPAPIKFKGTEAELSERDNSVWLEHSYYVKESNSAEDTLQICSPI